MTRRRRSRRSAQLLGFLFLTAAYLFAWPTVSLVYVGADVLHLLAGVWLGLAILPEAVRLFRGEVAPARLGWLLIALGTGLGIALIFTGTRRDMWWLLYAHIVACLAGIAVLVTVWLGKEGWVAAGILRLACVAAVLAAISAGAWWLRSVPWQRGYRIANPPIAPASMDGEGDGPSGPFFPSSAQTVGRQKIPAKFFMESDACERCHATIYEEWKSSAHHFSSFNNQWYRKSVEYMQDVAGVKPSKWCGGCHDPAVLYSGMMDTPIRQIVHTPEAQAGMGCMMCHSIVQVKSTMGQGDFRLEYPALHELAASKNPLIRRLHDFLVELNPEPHRRTFLKPFLRAQTAQFCSACHKVHLDVPVDHYRWTRGFNEYDNWQASAVSGEGARSFYYPVKPQTCADCHMPLVPSGEAGNVNGFLHSHRFPAANTALPVANEDADQLAATEAFLKNQIVSVDIFAVAPETTPLASPELAGRKFETAFAVGEEAAPAEFTGPAPPAAPVSAPLNRTDAAVRRGEAVRVDVVVRTRGVGHFFPGGTVDAFDVWLELKVTDEAGKAIFWSGQVEDDGHGPVDPGAHFYRSLLIDGHGNPINKRNVWAERAVVYVHLIPPGAADTAHFRLVVPRDATDLIHLDAKLEYRKFSWWNTQFSFAGVPDPAQAHPAVTPDYDDTRYVFTGSTADVSAKEKKIPDLPIVTLAEDTSTLRVLPATSSPPERKAVLDPRDWQRWNDYGIGLLLQGDLKGAEAAFENAAGVDAENPDGWVNIGRALVEEGNLARAKKALEKALQLSPQLARAHFFYGHALRDEGRYDDAVPHLKVVLDQYPRDRVARNELGRIYFLERRYQEAIDQFRMTLAIDPEDLEANYNLMLCYTGLGETDQAAEFQKRYLRFKADEASQSLTGPYRQAHPQDNLERQPIHEHTSVPLGNAPARGKRASAGKAGGGR